MILVMGVSGCGKSTIAMGIAASRGMCYVDADDLHPKTNVDHMRAGHALSDEMRWPWLDICAQKSIESEVPIVLACSALKRSYRDHLRRRLGPFPIVHLHGSKQLINARMQARVDHYMPPSLLDSQFATLENLGEDEGGLVLDIAADPTALIARSLEFLSV